MKKILIGILMLTFYPSFSNAQRWDSLAGGLPSIANYDAVAALYVYNGNLYAGGSNTYVDSSSCITSWNGSIWSGLGAGIINEYYPCGACCINGPKVNALINYNGNLFVGGYFNNIATGVAHAVAQWNGSLWDSVSTGVSGAENAHYGCFDVTSFAVYNGDLYMGGYFKYTGDSTVLLNCIAKWNGASWSSVRLGVNGYVNCLCVCGGNLYAGGYFDSAGGVPAKNIAMWNGTQWAAVGSGINNSVYALCVYNGSLYAGGTFDTADGTKANNIAIWNGFTWSTPGSGIKSIPYNGVLALTVYGTDLCVGGYFDTAGGIPVNNIALWNGSNWSALGSGINGNVNALTTFNGALIAGGDFDSAGGIAANNIAEWISPLGMNKINTTNSNVSIYPNPNNGHFTIQSSGISGQSSVEIYNVLGEKVYTTPFTIHNSPFTINLNQPAGVYLYRVSAEDGSLIGEGKVVIE